MSPRMAHIMVKAGRKRAQRHFICSSAPIEYVCFSHQSVLFSVLFNLFTFGPYWRGTVYWFIVPRFLRVPLRAHKAPPPASGLALTLCRPVAGFCFRDRPCRERPCPSITRTSQGKKKKGEEEKKKKPLHEGLRDSSTAAQCGCVWIADVVGPLPPTVVFFCLFFFSATFSNKMRHLFNYQQEGVYLKVHYVFFWEVILIRGEKSSLTVFFFFFK